MRYTVLSYIYGYYERLHEVVQKDPDADYILVTDRKDLRSKTWRIVYEPRQREGPSEKMYAIRYNPFKYADTELCVRLDSSIGILRPLSPIIDKMQEGCYDRCLMIHPRRNRVTTEYKVWVAGRAYPEMQAWRCQNFIKNRLGYDTGNRGLFQCCFEVVRDNDLNRELNDMTLSALHKLSADGDIERIDQTIFSAITARFFQERIKILPVGQEIVEGGLMRWYCHNSCIPSVCHRKIRPIMFGRLCKTWEPRFP